MKRQLQHVYAHHVNDWRLHAAMLQAQQGRNPEAPLTIPEVARLHGFGIEATRRSLRRLAHRGLVTRKWESWLGVGRYRYWAHEERPE